MGGPGHPRLRPVDPAGATSPTSPTALALAAVLQPEDLLRNLEARAEALHQRLTESTSRFDVPRVFLFEVSGACPFPRTMRKRNAVR
jgi:hypothetical protein